MSVFKNCVKIYSVRSFQNDIIFDRSDDIDCFRYSVYFKEGLSREDFNGFILD